MSPLFKKKEFFSAPQKEKIVAAIAAMESETSGELRVYVENKNPYVDTVERAKEIFHKLNMQNTLHRNAVLLYIAVKHRELAIYADEGIYTITGSDHWNSTVKKMTAHFRENDICDAILQAIQLTGQTLKEKFPYEGAKDKNEFSDDIVFGE